METIETVSCKTNVGLNLTILEMKEYEISQMTEIKNSAYSRSETIRMFFMKTKMSLLGREGHVNLQHIKKKKQQ